MVCIADENIPRETFSCVPQHRLSLSDEVEGQEEEERMTTTNTDYPTTSTPTSSTSTPATPCSYPTSTKCKKTNSGRSC